MACIDPARMQQVLDIPKRQREADVQHQGPTSAESEPLSAGGGGRLEPVGALAVVSRQWARERTCGSTALTARKAVEIKLPKDSEMHSIIYLVGLIVVVMAILSFVGLA